MKNKIILPFAVLFLFSCGNETPSWSIPEVNLPTLDGVNQRIAEGRKLPKGQRKEAAFELYHDYCRSGYMKPMAKASSRASIKTRYFSSLMADPLSFLAGRSLSRAVAVKTAIKEADDSSSFAASIKTREDLIAFARSKGYEVKDELKLFGNNSKSFDTFDFFGNDWLNPERREFFVTVNRGLFRFDASGKAIPDLAASVTKAEDGVTYTITLGEHYWKNAAGESLRRITAQDFAYAYNEFWKDSEYALFKEPNHVKSLAASNESTLIAVADAPDSEFLRNFDEIFNYPAAQDYRSSYANYGKSPESTVFSGDYAVKYESPTLTITALEEGIMPKIVFTDGYASGDQDFEDGKTDCVHSVPSRIALSLVLTLDKRYIDEKHKGALDNPYFRYAVMSLFPRSEVNAYYGYEDSRYTPTWLPYQQFPNEESKPSEDFLDESIPYAVGCFQKAKEQLGSSFFAEPVKIDIAHYGHQAFLDTLKARSNEIFGKDLEINAFCPSCSGDFDSKATYSLLKLDYFAVSHIDLLESIANYIG